MDRTAKLCFVLSVTSSSTVTPTKVAGANLSPHFGMEIALVMVKMKKIGTKSLRVLATSKGSATMLARQMNSAGQVLTIGPRDEDEGGASILIEYKSKAEREVAILAAERISEKAVESITTSEGIDMTAKKSSTKRPQRKAAETKSKKTSAKKSSGKPAKKAATKKVAAKKSARRGVGSLVKGMIAAGKSDEAIIKSVRKEFPDSAFNEKHKQHLPWYRHQVQKAS